MGRKPKGFKSAEFIEDTDDSNSVLDITSDSDMSSSLLGSTSDSSVVDILNTRDSVDRELDAMDSIPIPPPVAEPISVQAPPSSTASKKTKCCAYIVIL